MFCFDCSGVFQQGELLFAAHLLAALSRLVTQLTLVSDYSHEVATTVFSGGRSVLGAHIGHFTAQVSGRFMDGIRIIAVMLGINFTLCLTLRHHGFLPGVWSNLSCQRSKSVNSGHGHMPHLFHCYFPHLIHSPLSSIHSFTG